jgi:predicted exporter
MTHLAAQFADLPVLAFTPLYDPLFALYPRMSDHWLWFVIPLVLAISIVYKGTRVQTLKTLPKDAAIMSAQIVAIMAFAAVALASGYWMYLKFVGPVVQ